MPNLATTPGTIRNPAGPLGLQNLEGTIHPCVYIAMSQGDDALLALQEGLE